MRSSQTLHLTWNPVTMAASYKPPPLTERFDSFIQSRSLIIDYHSFDTQFIHLLLKGGFTCVFLDILLNLEVLPFSRL